jgi:4-hydroxyphenylpyruvate dioxygenase-like putative hemolysin
LPHLDIRDLLPEDRQSHHFNKVAATLDMSRVQMAAYLDAAEAALLQARSEGALPPPLTVQRAIGEQLSSGVRRRGGREAMFWVETTGRSTWSLRRRRQPTRSRVDPTISMALFRSPGWPYGIFEGDYRPGRG